MLKNNIFFLFFFLFVACGPKRYMGTPDGNVGDYRAIQTIEVSLDEQQRWKDLCDVLEEKSKIYEKKYKTIFTRFNFTTNYYACGGMPVSDDGQVVVKLNFNAPDLTYEIVSGQRFYSDVETHNRGLLGILCEEVKKGGTLRLPVKKGELSYWYKWGAPSCSASSEQSCVTVETLMKEGELLKEITEDRFYISLIPESLGDIKFHGRVDSSSCPAGQVLQFSTVLNSIVNL